MKPNSLFLTWYVKSNETIATNNIYTSKLIFGPQPRSLILESYQYIKHIFFSLSETTRRIEFQFHMKTPYDKLAKMYTTCFDHMTKISH